jgi:NADH-quinone oxidoreductase subunit J
MLSNAVINLLFYAFAITSVAFAIAMVISRRILRAAVYLMSVLVLSAGLYLLLGAEFLAGVQILVYVGGIVVLLVFAIMLTRSSELLEDRPTPIRKLSGLFASTLFLVVNIVVLMSTSFKISTEPKQTIDTTAAIGRKLLDQGATGYVLPFELISLLLLAAVIGGIVVARKTPVETDSNQ